MTDDTLFKNYKFCAQCRKPLSLSYPDDICPDCKERQLFNEVKEYIRSNVVNEYQVSNIFTFPTTKCVNGFGKDELNM